MTQRICDSCLTRPTRDTRTLCDQCAWELRRDLDQLPDLLDELDTTIGQQARISRGRGNPRRGMVTYNLHAADIRDQAHALLHQWTVTIHGGNPATWPAPEWLDPMCRLLAATVDGIAHRDDAARIHRDITDLTRRITRAIDRPADRIYAGTCGALVQPDPDTQPGDGTARGATGHWRCDQPLYARPGAGLVTCQTCGAHHDVRRRRDHMLNQLDDMLLPAAQIAGLVAYLGDLGTGRNQVRKLINQWHHRGRIASHGATRTGQPKFVFGEVLDLLTAWQAEREQRRAG